MDKEVRTVERVLAWFGGRAHGIVTRRELLRAGVSDTEIHKRVKKGQLIRQYRGVYRVGHCAPSPDASYMAAVEACGAGAQLSGLAGAWHLGLIKGPPPPPEVTAPREKRIPGIRTRRARRKGMKLRGIPVTTVAEVLVDIAPRLTAGELARACHEAGVKHKTTPRQVEAVLKTRPNAPGAGKLRAIMRGDTPVTLSEMERLGFEAVRHANLPLPEANRPADGKRVDLRWPGKLTVELQSYQFHNSHHAWEQDHTRRRQARKRGEEFRTYTWWDITHGRKEMIAEIRELLESR